MVLSTASPGPEGVLCHSTGWPAGLTDKNASLSYGKDLWQNSGMTKWQPLFKCSLLHTQESDGKRCAGCLRTCLMCFLTVSAVCIMCLHHIHSWVISPGPFTLPQHVPSYLHE